MNDESFIRSVAVEIAVEIAVEKRKLSSIAANRLLRNQCFDDTEPPQYFKISPVEMQWPHI